ncbi:hypothetical protein Btru_064648 [Bulinus truncatus]|nr:hypothetical protein Btru_064648 [Bulinus truncatus]
MFIKFHKKFEFERNLFTDKINKSVIRGLILFYTVTAQTSTQIVDRTQYYVGDTFNITCDITKFSGVPTSNYLTSLSLMRQTLTETKFTTIATYQPLDYPPEYKVSTLPSGRQWIVQYSGGDGYNNRQTMKIVTTVVGFRCDDAGLYKCVVVFPGSPTLYDSTVANVTVKAKISQDDLSVTPHNGDDPYSSTYYLEDTEYVTISMSCIFRGPGNLKAVWKWKLPQYSNEQNYPNDIVDETPVTSTSAGCTSRSYRSTLCFQLQPDNDGTTYYCTVEENNVEMNRANFTIVSVCSEGLWGIQCEQTCSKKCFETSCNQLNGECNRGCLGYEDSPECKRSKHQLYYRTDPQKTLQASDFNVRPKSVYDTID